MTPPHETVWNYGYDYENRLVSAADNADYTAAYTYSPDGLRLRVQESNNPNPDRWMQYNGVRPVLEGTLSGDTYTTTAKYAWEGDSYYDPLISASIGGQDRFYLFDGLGSTRQLLDGDQAVTDSYSYEAFGNVLSDGGPTPNPYRYVGSLGYYQTGNDLMHLGARYYMPETGRFTAQDPLPRQSGGDYLYSGSSPIARVDPSGLAFGITRAYCMTRYNWIKNSAQTNAEQCRCDIAKAANEASASFDMSCKTGCSHIPQDQIRSDCYRQCDLAAGYIKDFMMQGTKACDIIESAGLAAADAHLAACLAIADLPDPHLPHIPWPPRFWR